MEKIKVIRTEEIDSPLLDVAEACKYLRIGRTSLFKYKVKYGLKEVRWGKRLFFTREDLDSVIRLRAESSQRDLLCVAT